MNGLQKSLQINSSLSDIYKMTVTLEKYWILKQENLLKFQCLFKWFLEHLNFYISAISIFVRYWYFIFIVSDIQSLTENIYMHLLAIECFGISSLPYWFH